MPKPLSIAAIGLAHHDGEKNVLSERVRQTELTWVVDETHYFCQIDLEGLQVPVRGPGYLQLTSPEILTKPEVLYQVNTLSLPKNLERCKLHSLINPQNQSLHLISDLDFNTSWYERDNLPRLDDFEIAYLQGDSRDKVDQLEALEQSWGLHPRYTYLRGLYSLATEQFREAKEYFHASSLLGHLDGHQAELLATRRATKHFREQHPEIFSAIQRGDQLRVLTQLRLLRDSFPLEANATLAYCLRHSHEWLEGIEVCQAALALDPDQSDVYGHLWSYLMQLGRDEEAFEVAVAHLSHYPQNPQAYTDALDSCLLLGDMELAKWYTFGYLIHATNLNTALKNLFKFFDQKREWPKARQFFETIIPLLRSPTPQTLVYYGEILLELGETEKALGPLDRAMMAAPEDAQVVLANGRALAKAGRLGSAIKLISTVLADKGRNDPPADHFLMLSFLSELYRNNEDLASALTLWPAVSDMDESLLSNVGPRPFVEMAYCLGERGSVEDALSILKMLKRDFEDLYIVVQLEADLNSLLD